MALIITALPLFAGMKRDGNEDRAAKKGGDMIIGPDDRLKIPHDMEPVMVLEGDNQVPHRSLEERHRPPLAEGGMQADAMRTHSLAFDLAEEGVPAGPAMRLANGRDQMRAARAEMTQRASLA